MESSEISSKINGKKKKKGFPAHSSDDTKECARNPFAPAGLNNNNWAHLLPLSEYNTEKPGGVFRAR